MYLSSLDATLDFVFLCDYVARIPVTIGPRGAVRTAKFGAGTSLNKHIDTNCFPIYPNAYLPNLFELFHLRVTSAFGAYGSHILPLPFQSHAKFPQIH